MSNTPSQRKVVKFDEIETDLQAGWLFRQGVKVKLREQLVVVLSALLERAGEIVTREELQRWVQPGDVFVDFGFSLNKIIAKLWEALGDLADYPRYIETVPKRGYRFLETPSPSPSSESDLPRRTRVVLLPLSNLASDSAEEYSSDAMTDEIITALSK